VRNRRKEFERKLGSIDPDRDAVVIFRPNSGATFYISDYFRAQIRAGHEIPAYVWALLLHTHLYRYFDNPEIQEFMKKMNAQILLDLEADESEPPRA
jgi:hypothetical protein